MRFLPLALLAMVTTSLFAADPTAFEVANVIDLVPTPREISLSGEFVSTSDLSIIIPDGHELAATGAKEINDRLQALGTPTRPVMNQLGAGNALLIANCGTPLGREWAKRLNITPRSPGPQGYAIGAFRDGNRNIVAVIGSDDLGTLYACMTLRQLVQKRAGSVVLLDASVRDWPAFRRRCLGSIGRTFRGSFQASEGQDVQEAYVETWKQYIRFLARHKINMANVSVSRAMGQDVRRQLMDYGRQYGLKYRYIFGTAINEDLKATGTPWTDCVTRKSARHCWTAFEAHRHKANRIAEHVGDMGYDYVVLHVTDSGGLPDPEKWSERCQRCRRHYGDDQASAVSQQLKLYHDTIKQRNPDVLFEAVLQPYHFQWTTEAFEQDPLGAADDMPHYGHTRGMEDPDVRQAAVARATAIHRATSRLLPDDVLVTFREAGREEFEGCAALWPGHPVDIWVYFGRNKAWEGLWEPQVRFTKTWVRRDDPGDLLYNAPVGRLATVNEIYAGGSAEYAWSIEQPDAEPTFEISKRRYNAGGNEISDYQRMSLLPRLCHRLWGRSGDAVLPLFTNNVSFNYIADPQYVASSRGEDFADVYQHSQAMTELLQRVRPAINAEVARIDAGQPTGLYGDLQQEPGYTSFMWLYYYANLAAIKARIESVVLDLQRLVAEDRVEEARTLAGEFQQNRVPRWLAEVEAVKQRMRDDPHIRYRPRWREAPPGGDRPSFNALNGPYFDEVPKRIAELIPQMLRNARLGAIPDHLRQWLQERTIEAAKVDFRNPFQADGGRGEGGWTSTRVVEFLTIAGRDSLARYPTRVWIVWDSEALSIMAEMRDESSAKAVAETRDHDGPLFTDDCFELLLKPSEASDTYYHFAVNAAGTTFDSLGKKPPADWNPQWQAGVAQRLNGWSAELRIPFEVIGQVPRDGDRWKINLARHRAAKPRSPRRELSSIIDSPSHHATEEFQVLHFQPSRGSRPKSPEIQLQDIVRRDATVTYGFATQLSVRPEITAWVQATDVRVTVDVFDGDKQVASALVGLAVLPGYWKAERTLDMDLGDVIQGDLRVIVKAVSEDKALDAKTEFIVDSDGNLNQ